MVAAHPSPASTPLFLYLAFQGVHSPAEVPDRYRDAYPDSHERRVFAGMLSCVDEGIKNVSPLANNNPFLLLKVLELTCCLGHPRSNSLYNT